MKSYNQVDTDDENIVEVEEDYTSRQSHQISNSIHNFAEIMTSNESKQRSDRFSGAYNPRRRKLLTETDQTNIDNQPNPSKNTDKYHRKTDFYNFNNRIAVDENKPMEEVKNESFNKFQEIDEEIYEEASSQFINSEHKSYNLDEATFSPSNKPSTNRDTTGKLRYIEQHDSGLHDAGSSDDNVYVNGEQNDIPVENYELKQVVTEIDYLYVDQSIKNRRWINRDIMQKRDSSRVADHKRIEAERSLRREFQELEEHRIHNKVHTNKKSRKLAQISLKKKIKTVVNTYSQNGYLAFENFLNVLYMLQITQNIGKVDEDYTKNDRIKRIKEEREAAELEFALQFWNKIN